MVHFDVMVPGERAGKLGTRGPQRGALKVDCEQRTSLKCGRV